MIIDVCTADCPGSVLGKPHVHLPDPSLRKASHDYGSLASDGRPGHATAKPPLNAGEATESEFYRQGYGQPEIAKLKERKP